MKAKRTIERPAKRTSSKTRALVRGEPVVRGVLEATLEELAHAGYGALRVEDVAARAGVNKTTIYRRWPTKQDLVGAALHTITAGRVITPNTGSLRGDLLATARRVVTNASSAEGQGLIRMLLAEGQDSELMAIARSLHKSFETVPRSVIEAAELRGEIAPGVDALLLFNVLVAAVHQRLFMSRETVDDSFLNSLVELLLFGVLAPHKRAKGFALLE